MYMAEEFDYDLIIVGCGVGGHGAALHARSCGKPAVLLDHATLLLRITIFAAAYAVVLVLLS